MSFRRPASRRWPGPLALATGASLLVHLLLLLGLSMAQPSATTLADRARADEPVVIEPAPDEPHLVEPPEKVERPQRLAESADSGDHRKPPPDAFLGERDQRVAKETRARRVGRFAPGGPVGSDVQAPRERQSDHGPKELAMSDLLAVEDQNASPAAASDDAVGDVASGELTLLNTREYKFFSFYRRMKDALRHVWRREVEARNAALVADGKLVSASELVTTLKIELGAEGDLRQANILYSSGIDAFDEAALFAFRSVGRFPNPPAGMKGADGKVRLRWEFVIYGNQSSAFRIARDNAGSNRRIF